MMRPRYRGVPSHRIPVAGSAQPVPASYNAMAYVFGGPGLFGAEARPARDGQAVLFAGDAEPVTLAAPEAAGEPLDVLLLTDVPLHEPIARYGPLVMNTETEIRQAIAD